MFRLGTRSRTEQGATTAEYVGIVAFVSLLVVTLFTLSNPFKDSTESILGKAFCEIGSAFGFAGCTSSDLPHYVADKCQISANGSQVGGSISIVATAGGDSGYTLYRNRVLNDDGGIDDTFVVKTMGEISASYEFGPKGGVEVDTGSGGANAEGGANFSLAGNFTTGSNYEFDNREDAEAFIEAYQDQWGALGGEVEGGPDATSTYYELGGKGEVSGDLGPLAEGTAGARGMLGLETFPNGDKKVKAALTIEGAIDMGIPLPERILEASAKGEISAMVLADITFDSEGRVAALGGEAMFTVEAEGGVDFAEPYEGRHRAEQEHELTRLNMPQIPHLDAGATGTLAFSTQFRGDDGNYEYESIDALSEVVSSYISGEGEMTAEQAEAIRNQLDERSQITFALSSYDKDTEKFGAEGKLFFVTVGGEVHQITTEENILAGFYYNPRTNGWEENILCEA